MVIDSSCKSFSCLSNERLDLIKEVGNIGAGHAATALSTMFNKRIEMKVPFVNVLTFQEALEITGGPENTVVGLYLRVDGEISGNLFCLLTVEQAEKMASEMLEKQGADYTSLRDRMSVSVLKEVANIILGAFISAISDLTKLPMYPTVPSINVDMAGALISFGLIELSQASDVVLVINTSLFEAEYNQTVIDCNLLFILDNPSYEKLFHAIEVSDK
ncbi:chemotaxis protein CheC [Cytobacillus horneckiae]|uniref:Chemotaxis protein CheC n=1 Tax=Cytobacillus horneckiae TaxID=549687 RepID=A0A2N0ZM02_9BACI|nr:chemotaxis protein CheC [Cytobacillus horneckiae]MBN6887187.1 chemotaxis protein CheC [Cytobacillus horneckiae]MCM3178222.1 chemotaxis protein CheC [Cytobacillus horneckiae]MEC1157038.1 chemotaxis protein CheC [Cytobacillus horneckiae]MED2939936.1 chemotaxis protein CheC [Cytobacillus horneckiae]PKG30533.1 chemotaxis protein CheC [Cytobacillus horneckiae]